MHGSGNSGRPHACWTRLGTRPWAVIGHWAVALSALTFSSCGGPPMQQQAPPPPAVVVETPSVSMVTDYIYATGTTEAMQAVDVRARVRGFLEEIRFQPREIVKQGQILFTIEKAPYEQAVNQAAASLNSAKANLTLADATLRRMESALKDNAISEVQVIEQRAAKEQAAAAVEAAQAALEQAQLDLSYTDVRSPIEGRVSRHLVDVGNMVGASELTLLTRVIQDTPIYAYFTIDETQHIQYRRENQAALTQSGIDGTLPVALGLAGEEGYPHEGRVDFMSPEVDAGTGTVTVRGVFPNEDGLLEPGYFSRIRLPLGPPRERLTIPETAVINDLTGQFVYALDEKDTATYRPVKTGAQVNHARVILEGLTPEDRVVVEGMQSLRPGSPVTITGRKASAPAESDNAESTGARP